jgi:hypothetical protein
MATKTPDQPSVVDVEPVAPPAQTPEQIAATEQALGLAPKGNGQALAKAPVRMGVAPTTIEEAWRLATFFAKSELVPKQYRDRPADVMVAIQYGMEVGLPPAAALHSIFVTNGRPSLWGDGLLAVIMANPVYKDHDEFYMVTVERTIEGVKQLVGERREFLLAPDLLKDDTTAVTTFWRKDSVRPRTATFSVAKAKKAGLWSKAGPWSEYPDRMLKMRARGFAAHDCFPDVLKGMRTTEEAIDIGDVIEEVPPRAVRRLSETPPPAASTVTTSGVAPVPSGPSAVADETHVLVAGIADVQQTLGGGWRITLSDGKEICTLAAPDALELEKFKGSTHAVRLQYHREGGEFILDGFGIAE